MNTANKKGVLDGVLLSEKKNCSDIVEYITHDRVMSFLGDDDNKEIARYLSTHLIELGNGELSVKEFIMMYINDGGLDEICN